MPENPNWIAWDEANKQEDPDRDVEVNGTVPGGGSSSYGDEDAQDAVGMNYDSTLAYDDSGPSFGVASGGITNKHIASGAVGSNELVSEAVEDIIGAILTYGLAYDDANNEIKMASALSGQVQLSSGTAVVDTGISAADATFQLALGVDDPNADCKLTGRLFWDDAAGTYQIEIVEDGTSVGNPTVNYDVVRVR